MLQFVDEAEVLRFVQEEMKLQFVSQAEYANMRKNISWYIFTPEGRAALRVNRFYYVKEIREKLAVAFNTDFACIRCKHEGTDGDVCRKCHVVQNILKSL